MPKIDRRTLLGAATMTLLGMKSDKTTTSAQKGTSPKRPPAAGRAAAPPTSPRTVGPPNVRLPKPPALSPLVRAKRPQSNAWADILADARSAYMLPNLAEPLPNLARRIDDDYKHTASDAPAYRPWHVEKNINAMADLLDRCIAERAQWNELAARALDVRLAIEEYARLDAIHQEETAAGYYDIAASESQGEADAEYLRGQSDFTAVVYLDALLNDYFSAEEIQRQSGFQQQAAWVSHFATYAQDHKGDLTQIGWNNSPDTVPNHLYNAAIGSSYHLLNSQRASIAADVESRRLSERSADARLGGKRARARWEHLNAGFQRRRTDVLREIADLRAKAYSAAGGALNFTEQMQPLKARFERDYGEVLSRLTAVLVGLDDLYGFALEGAPTLKDGNLRFDDVVLWTRQVIAWLNRFHELEEEWVLPVSVRNCLSRSEWQTFLQTGVCRPEVVSDTFIPGHAHARLRGISVSVVYRLLAPTESGVWQAAVRVPEASYCRHLSGRRVDLDQSHVPVVRSSRVTSRDAIRDPDVVGVSAMHNASPYGIWTVSIGPYSSAKLTRKQLADVYLDLHLASRATEPM